jgi:nitrite reductase/ring-hydroxylating ferredoxin subunit
MPDRRSIVETRENQLLAEKGGKPIGERIQSFPPVYFSMVMATGIVSIAAYLDGISVVPILLLWLLPFFMCCSGYFRWREDFPIQWEKDEYVTRREMVKFLSLGSFLIAGANFIAAAIPRLQRRGEFHRVRIASAYEIAAGSSVLFRYPTDEDPCILVRHRAGNLVAYSQACTHLSCAVVHRPEENTLFCPCHHGYFSVEEGRPTAGPPTRPLPRIKLEQSGSNGEHIIV